MKVCSGVRITKSSPMLISFKIERRERNVFILLLMLIYLLDVFCLSSGFFPLLILFLLYISSSAHTDPPLSSVVWEGGFRCFLAERRSRWCPWVHISVGSSVLKVGSFVTTGGVRTDMKLAGSQGDQTLTLMKMRITSVRGGKEVRGCGRKCWCGADTVLAHCYFQALLDS